MRYGDKTSSVNNVLTGTPYAQLARGTRVKIRAFQHNSGNSANAFPTWNPSFAVLTSGSITQSRVLVAQQYSGYIGQPGSGTASKTGVGNPPARLGTTDCDTIFEGVLPAGSISLTFPGATATKPVVWDIEI